MPVSLSRQSFLDLAGDLLVEELSYSRRDLRFDYRLPTGEGQFVLDLLAFGEKRHDQETSCLAFHFCAPGRERAALVASAALLAVPLGFFARPDGRVDVIKWVSDGEPKVIDGLADTGELCKYIRREAKDLRATALLAAKRQTGRQSTFVDAGLLDFAFQAAPRELPGIYQDLALGAETRIRQVEPERKDPRESALRASVLLFGARFLSDKGAFSARSTDARSLLTAAGSSGRFPTFFGREKWEDLPVEVLDWICDRLKQWRFDFLGPYGLGMLYESAFVDEERRRRYAIYYTPLAVSQFLLQHLPIDEIPCDDRSVLDPTAGSGSFLLTALRRLRHLYEQEKSVPAPPSWCRRMIHGRDTDRFACWIAELSLMDETRWNGWDIQGGDLSELDIRSIPQRPAIIIGNPPFELTRVALQKAVSQLGDGGLLGFVLPYKYRGQVSPGAQKSRRELLESCEILEIADLPPGLFTEAAEPSMILLARKRTGGPRRNWTIIERNMEGPASEYRSRVFRGEFAAPRQVRQADWLARGDYWMYSPRLGELWERLRQLPVLLDYCEKPHLGIQLRRDKPKEGERIDPTLVQTTNPGGFVPFLRSTGGARSTYGLPIAAEVPYLDYYGRKDEIYRPLSFQDMEARKVLIPRTVDTQYAWRLMAYVDDVGLFAENTFLYVLPRPNKQDLWLTAAALNTPVANAWLAEHSNERNISPSLLAKLPWPPLEPQVGELVSELAFHLARVQRERGAGQAYQPQGLGNGAWIGWLARCLTLGIDEILIGAYGLSDEEQRVVLSLCPPEERPGFPKEAPGGPVGVATIRRRASKGSLSTCGRVLTLDKEEGLAALAIDGLALGLPVPVRLGELPAEVRKAGAHIRLKASLGAQRVDEVVLAGIKPFPEADRPRSELMAELRRITEPLPGEVHLGE
jgi:hypothetical protein